jgi:hypothetical protein
VSDKSPISIRLSAECRDLIAKIGAHLGIPGKTGAVIEMAVRRMARQELGEAPAPAPAKAPKRKRRPD